MFQNLVYQDLVDYFLNVDRNAADDRILLAEECAELTEKVLRTFRNDRTVKLEEIAEEMSHVLLMMVKVGVLFGIDSTMLQSAIDEKRRKYGLL